jgi:protein pelota
VFSKALKHLRVMQETEIIEKILKRLGKGESNVTYGFDEVKRAAELGAVKKLVLADTMLRETSDEKRLRLEDLMKKVEHKGGAIIVVSTEHEAGTKLLALGGIAALLRFSFY